MLSWLSPISTPVPGTSAWATLPFGPSAWKTPSAPRGFTPVGTLMGFLPIRDMTDPLPTFAEDLAAHALVACLAVGEQALRGGDDADAHAVEHGLDLLGTLVDAEAGRGDPAQHGDVRVAVLGVAEEDTDEVAGLALDELDALDVPLLHEDADNPRLDARCRHA